MVNCLYKILIRSRKLSCSIVQWPNFFLEEKQLGDLEILQFIGKSVYFESVGVQLGLSSLLGKRFSEGNYCVIVIIKMKYKEWIKMFNIDFLSLSNFLNHKNYVNNSLDIKEKLFILVCSKISNI